MTDTTHTDADRIDPDRAAMHGHAEARERLLALGRTEEQVDELEDYARGFADFARIVAEAERREQ